jgi:hypothetical protein
MAAEAVPLWCIREFEEQRRLLKEEQEKAADALLEQQRRVAVKQAAAAQYAQEKARLKAGMFQSPMQHAPVSHFGTGMTAAFPYTILAAQPVASMYPAHALHSPAMQPMYTQPGHPQLPSVSHLLGTPGTELGGSSVHHPLQSTVSGLNYASIAPLSSQPFPVLPPFTPVFTPVSSYANSAAPHPSAGSDSYFRGLHSYTDLAPSSANSSALPQPPARYEDASTRLLQQFEQARYAQECFTFEQERLAMEREYELELQRQERVREKIERDTRRQQAEDEKELRRLEREEKRLEREKEKEQRAVQKSERKRQREEELELKRQLKLDSERETTERRWREFPDLMQRIEVLQTDLQSRNEASLLQEYPTAHETMAMEKLKRELDVLRKQVTLKDRKNQMRGEGARARAKDKKLYCLCKTVYDDSQFYIGCDECNNWFHAHCVGVSEADAESLEVYTCPKCRGSANADEADAVTRLFGSPSTSSGSDRSSVGCADEAEELSVAQNVQPRLRYSADEESCSTRIFVRTDLLRAMNLEGVLLEIQSRPRAPTEVCAAEAARAGGSALPDENESRRAPASRRAPTALVASEAAMDELARIWRALKEIDAAAKYQMFASPVDPIAVHDYYKVVPSPMDLSTMQRKLRGRRYLTVDEMHVDFELMCQNALRYNPPGDEFHNEALRVRKECRLALAFGIQHPFCLATLSRASTARTLTCARTQLNTRSRTRLNPSKPRTLRRTVFGTLEGLGLSLSHLSWAAVDEMLCLSSTVAQIEGTRALVAAGSSLAVPECAEPLRVPRADTPPLPAASGGKARRTPARSGVCAADSAEANAADLAVPSGVSQTKLRAAASEPTAAAIFTERAVRSMRSGGAGELPIHTTDTESRASVPAAACTERIHDTPDGWSPARTRRSVHAAEESEAEAIARVSTLLDDAKYARHVATLSSILVRNGVRTITDLAALDFSLLCLDRALLPSKAVCDNLAAMARMHAASDDADSVGTKGAPQHAEGRRKKRKAETLEDASQDAHASRRCSGSAQPEETVGRRTRR